MYDMSIIKAFALTLVDNSIFTSDLLESENIVALWFAINHEYIEECDRDGTIGLVRGYFEDYLAGGADLVRFSAAIHAVCAD